MLVRGRRDLQLETLAPGLGDIENQPRRARTCRQDQLQVTNVHVECGRVDGRSATSNARLHSHLVIPRRLVCPGLVPSERNPVLRGTYWTVQRIVDAAQPESFRDLCVECERVGRLVIDRSEEHTSELQSRPHLVCRLLLENTTP